MPSKKGKKTKKEILHEIMMDGLLAGLNYADTYGRDGDDNELTEQAAKTIEEIKTAIAALKRG